MITVALLVLALSLAAYYYVSVMDYRPPSNLPPEPHPHRAEPDPVVHRPPSLFPSIPERSDAEIAELELKVYTNETLAWARSLTDHIEDYRR